MGLRGLPWRAGSWRCRGAARGARPKRGSLPQCSMADKGAREAPPAGEGGCSFPGRRYDRPFHAGDPPMRRTLLVASLAVLLAPPLLQAAEPAGDTALLLACERLFDAESGKLLGPHTIQVRNQRIVAVA